jgi:hypothetical protein
VLLVLNNNRLGANMKNLIRWSVFFCSCLRLAQGFVPTLVRQGTLGHGALLERDTHELGQQLHGRYCPNRGTRSREGALHKATSTVLSMALMPEAAAILSHVVETGSTFTLALERNDIIQQAFNVANFGPQIFWLFLILLPKSNITKAIMGDYKVITFFALVHLAIVILSASEPNGTAPIAEFADVFDPAGNPQHAMVGMMKYPNFVSEEWSHVLTWDLLVGRWIWLDGLKRGVFTSHSVLFCNLIGPPGFLIHVVTCLVTGKGFIVGQNEAMDIPVEDESKQF